MPKTITDIIPPSRRRSMQDVAPPPAEAPAQFTPSMPPQMPPPPPAPPRALYIRPRRRFPWGFAIAALVIIAACVGVMYAFAGAKVEITPTTSQAAISGSYTAMPSSGDLPFAVVTVQKTASESVPAESTVTANDTAQGSITIYNTQAKPQQLINNTRFETSSGLIFRIHQSVSVPAAVGGNPGTLNATVYADSAGATYNVPATSFTLPGLAGSPQASQVYAKSTAAMAGGFSGTRPAVSQATDDAEHAKLQSTLAAQITSEVTPKIPDGYVLVPGSVFTTYQTLPDAADTNGGVSVRVEADATAVVFPADALAKTLAPTVIGAQYAGQAVALKDVSGISLSAGSSTPSATSPFTFTLAGNATLVWQVDTTKVAGAVAGKSTAAARSVLTGFPEIQSAHLTLRPFWRRAFPADPADITITVDGSTTP